MEDQPQPAVAPAVAPPPIPTNGAPATVVPANADLPEAAATDNAEPEVDQGAPADELDEPEGDQAELDPSVPEQPITWEASEYIHHTKGMGWYAGLGGVVVVLLILAAILHSWLGIGVFIVMAVAIAVYAQKPPRVLTYQLDGVNVTIDGKIYPYENFRSYAVLSDTEWHAIDLEPTQRFMPRLTVLFSDDDFDLIVDHLDLHLPRVDREPDLIERLSRYLRF